MEMNTITEKIINAQVTCNAREEFTSRNAQWPGSVHDRRIIKITLKNNMRHNNMVLLGDCGCEISAWLMTPYRNP
nr:unnamed protein product [Callosobruchus analis]